MDRRQGTKSFTCFNSLNLLFVKKKMLNFCFRVLVDHLIDTEEKKRGGGTANEAKDEQQVEANGGVLKEAGTVDVNLKGPAKSSASTMELELDSEMLEALGELITDLGPSSA